MYIESKTIIKRFWWTAAAFKQVYKEAFGIITTLIRTILSWTKCSASKYYFPVPQWTRIGIRVCKNSRLYIKNCTFIGGNIGIKINTLANEVLIVNCKFINCGNETPFDKKGSNGAIVIEHGCQSLNDITSRLNVDNDKADHVIYDHGNGQLNELTGLAISDGYPWLVSSMKTGKTKKLMSNNLDIRILRNEFSNNYGYTYPVVFTNYEKGSKEEEEEVKQSNCLTEKQINASKFIMDKVLEKCQLSNNKLSGLMQQKLSKRWQFMSIPSIKQYLDPVWMRSHDSNDICLICHFDSELSRVGIINILSMTQ